MYTSCPDRQLGIPDARVHLAAIMIYEAAPFLRACRPARGMRPLHDLSFRNRQFREHIAHVSARLCAVNRLLPLSALHPVFSAFLAVPSRPPLDARSHLVLPAESWAARNACMQANHSHTRFVEHYRPNTEHREPSLLARCRSRERENVKKAVWCSVGRLQVRPRR